jgi:hypothetical protein
MKNIAFAVTALVILISPPVLRGGEKMGSRRASKHLKGAYENRGEAITPFHFSWHYLLQ